MSNDTYNKLVDAGAGRLPDSYFYRIRHGSLLGADTLTVQVRHRVWNEWPLYSYLPLTWKVAQCRLLLDDNQSHLAYMDLVVYACNRALKKSRLMENDLIRARKFQELEGDHP